MIKPQITSISRGVSDVDPKQDLHTESSRLSHRQVNLGRHCLLEASACDLDRLNDLDLILKAMRQSIARSGATLLQLRHHQFEPAGLTAFAMLSESHVSIHTWPELSYAAIDAFTCGEIDTAVICQGIAEAIGAKEIVIKTHLRGPKGA